MPSLTFRQLADLTGGRLVAGGDLVADSFVIDSREAKPGSVFFAIEGERLDGHDFLSHALQHSVGAVVSRQPEDLPPGKALILVDETTKALQSLARGVRNSIPFTLIAITGSAGKTTTKEMISTLVATEKKTWRSFGNFNNHIGFPVSMANTPDGTEVVVSEMGMSAKGEIEFLAQLSSPDIGVYTNIKPVHLEFFDSIDGIAAAKRELLENLRPGGTVVINADDHRVVGISEGFPGPRVTYGVDSPADYRALNLRDRGLLGSSFTLEAEGSQRDLELSQPGRHNLDNLLAAIAAARVAGISWSGIERGIAEVSPAYHRGVIVPWNGATLYDDTYNSNPYALGRALELLEKAECTGRRIAVIGDMLELGGDELKFHYEAGAAVPSSVDTVIGVGSRARQVLEGARSAGFADERLHHFSDAEGATAFLRTFVRPGDLVLLKGSRGIGLDRVVTALAGEA